MPQRVFLIPGFFGFASFGEFAYFAHVHSLLTGALRARGIEATVIPVHTFPTSSIEARAARLLKTVAEASASDDDPIHLVGHSSGGLDARLFVSPSASLPSDIPLEPFARRVASVVSVATPHRGTPVARLFSGAVGQSLLALLSLATMYTLRFGRLPIVVLAKLISVFARLDDLVLLNRTILDQVREQLLADFSSERQFELEKFFKEVGTDQSLLEQLVPENMVSFNRSVKERPGVKFGSVVARSRRPGLTSTLSAGLDPYAQATHALYTALWTASTLMPDELVSDLEEPAMSLLRNAFNDLPKPSESDGVVPTLSQVHGEVLFAAWGDHLDLIGHFEDPDAVPPHFDWLASGSRFRRAHYEALWTEVATFIANSLPR